MQRPKLPMFGLMATMALFLFPDACIARNTKRDCGSLMCGNVNISFPFRLTTQPSKCGDRRFELECDNNNRTNLVMKHGRFYVRNITYESYTMESLDGNGSVKSTSQGESFWMQAIDSNLGKDDNCSLPRNSFRDSNYLCESPFVTLDSIMFLLKCTTPMISSSYINASRCPSSSSHPPASYFYFLDRETPPRDLNESCTIDALVPIRVSNISGMSTSDIYKKLLFGFEIEMFSFSYSEFQIDCRKNRFQIMLRSLLYALQTYAESFVHFLFNGPHLAPNTNYAPKSTNVLCLEVTGGVILARSLAGICCLIALVTYKWRRRHLSADDTIEEFLKRQNDLMPIRYSYREIKRITGGFKDKLGEGGFGSVFKGKLRSNYLVAVKLLGKSKANGEDFISEVATIGRIHHFNVAKLIGFCAEGSKQALVYDFMPNGSLDKFIFSEENKISLSWPKMLDIVLGITRGIEYLHRGCDMQILHFDIKPHNILLDENFIPKVSDFGLAKLYSVGDSIVSLTAARGTIGYIAPELVYKNLGGVSYKADVYSFGMLLLEIVGRRKNLNAFVEQSSRIYFPSWIYDRYSQGEDVELGDVTDDEKIIVRKMVITAFWCIQMKPADRPSMSKVLDMLETDAELLQIPPRPFQLPFDVSSEDQSSHVLTEDQTSTLLDSADEISVQIM